MINNKAAKALIIGACIAGSTMMGVYADTNTPVEKPAEQTYTIQIESVKVSDVLSKKQQEIDKYVFEEHQSELEKKGITITHTGVVGEFVEIGINPYSQENADYLYGIFGKDMVQVVAAEQAVPMEYVTAAGDKGAQTDADKAAWSGAAEAAQEDASFFTRIMSSILGWLKNIF